MQDENPSHGSHTQAAPVLDRSYRLLPRWMGIVRRVSIPGLGPAGTLLGIVGLFAGTIALGIVVAVVLRALIVSDALNPFSAGDSGATAVPNATPNPDFMAPTLDIGNQPTWQGTDRVTVLLMGGDRRPGEYRSRPLTDTLMLLMIDPQTKVASVLSIPRDLYVDIPGYGLNRINTAYVLGGPELAKQTVEYNFGIRVNYYVLVEFEAFTTFVDEIGGIDVYVPYDIYDPEYPDMNYGYDPFSITAGLHHMDGELALKYARTRHADSDFGRAQRQQDVLFAIRDKILSLDMLPTLIQRAPALYAALSDNIQTDLSLDQIISLALLAEDVPREFIRTGIVGSEYVSNYETDTGARVLIPNRERIGALLSEVFWLQ
jgi:LCP family protein required for cell wall assembly